MEVKKFLFLLIVVVILSGSLTYFFYNLFSFNNKVFYRDIRINEIDMELEVTPKKKAYGINIDTDAIYFGRLPIGAAGTRHVNVTNSYNYSIFFYITKEDSALSEIVGIGPNYFVLGSYKNRIVNVAVNVPEGFKPGNYSSKLNLMVRVPFFRAEEVIEDLSKTTNNR